MKDPRLLDAIANGVMGLAAIPFFPTNEHAQQAIMREVAKFVDRADRLQWLLDAALNTMTKWEGIPELRGLYCTRFKPADGIEGNCSLPGYSPGDCEAQHAIEANNHKQLSASMTLDDLKRAAKGQD